MAESKQGGEVHRDGAKVQVRKCVFPNCENLAVPGEDVPACTRHLALLDDVLFILDNTSVGGAPTPAEKREGRGRARIILPGDPGFNIGGTRP